MAWGIEEDGKLWDVAFATLGAACRHFDKEIAGRGGQTGHRFRIIAIALTPVDTSAAEQMERVT